MHELLIFNDANLLQQALTHRSYVNEKLGEAGHNERLEFLGDAILTFLSGDYLYRHYPDMEEGEMTRRRSALVDEEQLAQFAIQIGLEAELRLARGTYKNQNIFSSAFEAVVGAFYLDRNREISELRSLVKQLFDSVPEAILIARSTLHPKNQLQEILQANGITTPPSYKTDKVGGTSHAPEWISKVYVGDKFYGEGKGPNTKEADKQAAEDALRKLREDLV